MQNGRPDTTYWLGPNYRACIECGPEADYDADETDKCIRINYILIAFLCPAIIIIVILSVALKGADSDNYGPYNPNCKTSGYCE